MRDVETRNQAARPAARECNSTAALDSTLQFVRAEKEGEFVRAHKNVLDAHRDKQRTQVLRPD
jgi:hypothetical protein